MSDRAPLLCAKAMVITWQFEASLVSTPVALVPAGETGHKMHRTPRVVLTGDCYARVCGWYMGSPGVRPPGLPGQTCQRHQTG